MPDDSQNPSWDALLRRDGYSHREILRLTGLLRRAGDAARLGDKATVLILFKAAAAIIGPRPGRGQEAVLETFLRISRYDPET